MNIMKTIPIWLALGLLSCTDTDARPETTPLTLKAISDFTVPDNVGLYVDNDRKAIAIEAADPQFRNQLMGSTHVVNWLERPETFNVEFVYVSEKDGEPKYEFWVNERLIKSSIAEQTDEEFQNNSTHWRNIKISPDDIITIKSNAVTNGKIAEGDGTAYARGRWVSLTFSKD